MKKRIIKSSRRVYIVFGIIFGGIPILLILLGFLLQGFAIDIKDDLIFLSLFLVMLIFTYTMLAIYKISYDNKQIKYRGLFGTKTINIRDIKRYKIKAEIHTLSTKPIFGLFKITINNPMIPAFGLAIDTINKKSEIVIPAKLFTSESLNDLMNHINTINGSAKGKANAGKSVFSYREKKKKV